MDLYSALDDKYLAYKFLLTAVSTTRRRVTSPPSSNRRATLVTGSVYARRRRPSSKFGAPNTWPSVAVRSVQLQLMRGTVCQRQCSLLSQWTFFDAAWKLNCLRVRHVHFQDGGSPPSWILGVQNGLFEKPRYDFLYIVNRHRSSKLLSFWENRLFTCWRQNARWRISAILDFRGPIMGSLKSPCTTSYRSSIETIALNCLVFWENCLFCILGTDRQTDRQTNKRTDGHHNWNPMLGTLYAAHFVASVYIDTLISKRSDDY